MFVGIDCGPELCGFAFIETSHQAKPRLVLAAHDKPSFIEPARPDYRYAMEQIQGYAFNPSRVKHLVETARNEGRLERALQDCSLLVFSAREARSTFCRTPRASDAQVRLVVDDVLDIQVKIKAAIRAHVYDAALVAMLSMRANGVHIELSQDAEARLVGLQALENEKRNAKRKGKAA